MANQRIFCNVPWTNTHIYWDGSYGSCCSEQTKIHNNNQEYNIQRMDISEWYASQPMQHLRKQMLGDQPIPSCSSCYFEERNGYESRRIRENFKSVIFTNQSFDRSYQQSAWHTKFETGNYELPVDWHINLGNECNLACKMCHPSASSKIAQHHRKWDMLDQELPNNWTNNDRAWDRFISNLKSIPKLNRVHFMGGEPMLSKRFDQFVNEMHKSNISISFVTNGTLFKPELVDKLKKFTSCDVEISLESISKNNDYIRQGSSVDQVKKTILELATYQTKKFHVVLRSVPQLLNINNYDEYIMWAYRHNLPIQGIPLVVPNYLSIIVLPREIKNNLITKYQTLAEYFKQQLTNKPQEIVIGRSPDSLEQTFLRETESMIKILNFPEPANVEQLRQELVSWLMRWDREYTLDAREYYPEYTEFFERYGYTV